MEEPKAVLVRDKRNSADCLQHFAKRIEERLKKAKGSFALEQQVCRLIFSKDLKVSFVATKALVEWLYGKPTETLKVEGHIEHTVFDASKLSDEQLAEAERLVESARAGSDQE